MKKWSLNAILWASVSALFFTLLSLGQLQRWQLTPGIAVYGHDVVVLMSIVLGICERRFLLAVPVSGRPWTKWRLEIMLVAWVGLGWLLALVQHQPVLVGVLYALRLSAYVTFTWFLLQASVWSLLPEKWLGLRLRTWGYWVVGIATTYLGFLQYLVIPDTRFLGMIGWDNHYYRLIGPLLDPGFTGMVLVLTLLMTMGIKGNYYWLWWGVKILLTVGIALTYSRASYLALAAGLIALAGIHYWRSRQLLSEVVLLVVLVISLFLLPRPGGEGVNLARTSTITSRVINSQESVNELSLTERFVGRGLFLPTSIESDTTERPDFAKLPDNLFVLVFSNLGLVGSGLLLLWLGKHRTKWLAVPPFIQAAVIATLTHSQFNNTLFQPFVFLILTGMVVSYLTGNSGTRSEKRL